MKKFNIENYRNGKFVMHTKTEEAAQEFCALLHENGRIWHSGDSYVRKDNWSKYYKERTVYYFNDGRVGDIQSAKENGYTVLEWEDFQDCPKREFDLKELIHDKVSEIFAEYQKAHDIMDGDIGLHNTIKLEKIENCLEGLITHIYASRINKPCFYIYTDCEGEEHIVHLQTSKDKFFTEVSRKIAFDDLTDERVTCICWQGQIVNYAGWKPAMHMVYLDHDGIPVWSAYFPEWDH